MQFNKHKKLFIIFSIFFAISVNQSYAYNYMTEIDSIRATLSTIEDKNSTQYIKAKQKLEKLIIHNKIDYSDSARLNDAVRLINEEQYNSAIYELKSLITENYEKAKCFELLGDICAKTNKTAKKIGQYYKLALAENSKNYILTFKLAKLYVGENKNLPAIDYLNKTIENCNNAKFLNGLIGYVKENLQPENRLEANNLYELIGNIYQKLNQKENALKAYQIALKLNPDDIFLQYQLGNMYQNGNEDMSAIEVYDAILEENPKETAIRASKAKALASSGDINGADREYRQILKDNPKSNQALYGLYKLYGSNMQPDKILEKIYSNQQDYVSNKNDLLKFAKILKELNDSEGSNKFMAFIKKQEDEEKARILLEQKRIEEEKLRKQRLAEEERIRKQKLIEEEELKKKKLEQEKILQQQKLAKQKEEQERILKEKQRIEAQKKLEKQQELLRQKKEKEEQLKKEKLERQKRIEEENRIKKEKLEREAKEKELKLAKQKEEQERILKERKEKEAKLKAEQEELLKQRREKEAKIKEEQERISKERKEKEEQLKKERKQKEYEEKSIAQEKQKALAKNPEAYKKYEAEIKKYMDINPKDAKTYIAIANTYKMSGQPTSALKYYKEAQKLDPVDSDVYYNMGLIYMELGSYVTSKANLVKSIDLNKENIKAKNLLGFVNQKIVTNILNESYSKYEANDYISAFEILDKGIKEFPKNGEMYYYRALIFDKMNRNAAQIIDLQKAVEYNPGYYMAYYQLGQAYEKINDERSALYAYEKFLSTEPDEKDLIQEVQKKVEELSKKYY